MEELAYVPKFTFILVFQCFNICNLNFKFIFTNTTITSVKLNCVIEAFCLL